MELIADLHLSKLAFLSSDGGQFRIYIKHMPHCPAAKYICFSLIFKKKKKAILFDMLGKIFGW